MIFEISLNRSRSGSSSTGGTSGLAERLRNDLTNAATVGSPSSPTNLTLDEHSLSLMTNKYDPYRPIKIPIERGDVLAQIEDKSDCFNINVLVTNIEKSNKKIVNQDELKFFKNLLISLDTPDEKVEIISGLEEGDIIVAEGLKKVRPQGKIKPINK